MPNQLRFFVIRSQAHPNDLWSNDQGWTDSGAVTVFEAAERGTVDLPIGGEWVALAAP